MSTAPAAKLVEPGQGKTIMLYAVRFDYKVTTADSGGALSALEVTIPSRTLVKPHSHSREDEYTVVLAGTVGARSGTGWWRRARGRRWSSPAGSRTPCGTSGPSRPRCWRSSPRVAWSATSRS